MESPPSPEPTKNLERIRDLERLESLCQLSSSVAHDLNNILVAILGNVELVSMALSAEEIDRDLLREDLKQVLSAGERATDLTTRLQEFSRRRPTAAQALQLCEALTASAPALRHMAGEGVELRIEAPDTLPEVLIDPISLEVSLCCLVQNARRATGGAGTVTLRAEEHGPGQVTLCVIDDGRGMEEKELERATELFFSAGDQGAGLGLPTVRRLLFQAGGDMKVTSLAGEGTTVTLLLPTS